VDDVARAATVQASNRLLQGELRRVEVERACGHFLPRRLHLREHAFDVDSSVERRERREPPCRLLELPPRCDGTAAAGLVPGDRDVDETLEEVALLGRRRPPGVLERLVRGEELAAPNELEPARELVRDRP
jgi:hypothetical protein